MPWGEETLVDKFMLGFEQCQRNSDLMSQDILEQIT